MLDDELLDRLIAERQLLRDETNPVNDLGAGTRVRAPLQLAVVGAHYRAIPWP